MIKSPYTNINGEIEFIHGSDITPNAAMIQDCINKVKAEIFRMSKLPYATIRDRHKLLYLDELLTAYERDYKKYV